MRFDTIQKVRLYGKGEGVQQKSNKKWYRRDGVHPKRRCH